MIFNIGLGLGYTINAHSYNIWIVSKLIIVLIILLSNMKS